MTSPLRAALRDAIDGPWLAMSPIVVGDAPAGAEAPAAYVTVEMRPSRSTSVEVACFLDHSSLRAQRNPTASDATIDACRSLVRIPQTSSQKEPPR